MCFARKHVIKLHLLTLTKNSWVIMDTWTILFIINVILFVIANLIFLPMEIYYFRKFKQFEFTNIVARREKFLLTAVLVLGSIVSYGIYFTLMPILSYFRIHITTEWTVWVLTGLNTIVGVAYFFYVLRLWLIFYTVMKHYQCLKNKWQSLIDPTSCSKSWYLVNKTRLGTLTAVKKKLIVWIIYTNLVQFWMIGCMLYLHDTNLWWMHYIPLILMFINVYVPLGALWYAFHQLPFYQDSIGLCVYYLNLKILHHYSICVAVFL